MTSTPSAMASSIAASDGARCSSRRWPGRRRRSRPCRPRSCAAGAMPLIVAEVAALDRRRRRRRCRPRCWRCGCRGRCRHGWRCTRRGPVLRRAPCEEARRGSSARRSAWCCSRWRPTSRRSGTRRGTRRRRPSPCRGRVAGGDVPLGLRGCGQRPPGEGLRLGPDAGVDVATTTPSPACRRAALPAETPAAAEPQSRAGSSRRPGGRRPLRPSGRPCRWTTCRPACRSGRRRTR